MSIANITTATSKKVLSNISNNKKPVSKLLTTLFKKTDSIDKEIVQYNKEWRDQGVLPAGNRGDSNNKTAGNTRGDLKRTQTANISSIYVTGFKTLKADDLQGVPTLPDDASKKELESYAKFFKAEVEALEYDIELTREYHALGALLGLVKDKDGSVLIDVFDAMKASKQTEEINEADFAKEGAISTKLHALKQKAKKALKGASVKGWVAICGESMFTKLAHSKDACDAFKLGKLKHVMDGFDDGFNYQKIDFVEYPEEQEVKVDDNTLVLCPIVDGLYDLTYCPGDGTDFINKKGQKSYITTESLGHDVGVEIKIQSAYVPMVKAPEALTYVSIKKAGK